MKTFKDLEFKPHPNGEGILSHLDFDNGFTISVIAGGPFYSTPRRNSNDPDFFVAFEVAVFDVGGNFTKEFFPDSHDNVLGWQDRGQINALMLLIQSKK
jgi:hypothetical protein